MNYSCHKILPPFFTMIDGDITQNFNQFLLLMKMNINMEWNRIWHGLVVELVENLNEEVNLKVFDWWFIMLPVVEWWCMTNNRVVGTAAAAGIVSPIYCFTGEREVMESYTFHSQSENANLLHLDFHTCIFLFLFLVW